jgi:putative zinc finger protein
MHPNDAAINDFVDGTGDPLEQRTVEQHLATCMACRQLVEDLREIRHETAALELREPPVRVWVRIERAITLERRRTSPEAGALSPAPQGSRTSDTGAADGARLTGWLDRTTWRWLAAAAAIVLATVVGIRFVPGRDQPGSLPNRVDTTSAGDAAQAIESELRLAEAHYEKAIKGLEQIASTDQGALDPATAATLQKNLAVIDQAISESRAAVRSQPANEPAQQSLVENFKTKIGLLQDTVALINEMRKGNEAGAARIVSGLKQKGN